MTRTHKIEQLHLILLKATKPITIQSLIKELGCSRSTVYRLFESINQVKGRKVILDKESDGYKYSNYSSDIVQSLSHDELSNLIIIQNMLKKFDQDRIEQVFGNLDLVEMIDSIIVKRYPNQDNDQSLVKFIPDIARKVDDRYLSIIVDTINNKEFLKIIYRSRGKDEVTERVISPQQIVYFRHNWYLDSWCFKRKDWRIFALDAIEKCEVNQEKIADHEIATKDNSFDNPSSIFHGHHNKTATLIFSEKIAHLISKEQWHHKQIGRRLKDGRYELKVPYAYEVELLTDILKHGNDVFVQSPRPLRNLVIENSKRVLNEYKNYM